MLPYVVLFILTYLKYYQFKEEASMFDLLSISYQSILLAYKQNLSTCKLGQTNRLEPVMKRIQV